MSKHHESSSMSMKAHQSWQHTDTKAFYDALLTAYDPAALERMLRFQLDKQLKHLVHASSFQQVVFELIETAQREGWIIDFVRAAQTENPGNRQLAAFANKFELSSEPDVVSDGSMRPIATISEWVTALEQSPTMQNRDTRLLVIAMLPADIRNTVNNNLPTTRAQLRNLVKVCHNYTDGLLVLVGAIEELEGNSLTVQTLRTFVQ